MPRLVVVALFSPHTTSQGASGRPTSSVALARHSRTTYSRSTQQPHSAIEGAQPEGVSCVQAVSTHHTPSTLGGPACPIGESQCTLHML